MYLNDKTILSGEIVSKEIELSNIKQKENNNIIKENKNFYLKQYFYNKKNIFYKIIFVRWINYKKNIALVFFTVYNLELLIKLYISTDTFPNKIYKIKYNSKQDSNLLEFIN